MQNQHVLQRLTGIQQILMGVHRAGLSMSSSSRGSERQAFIDSFLREVPPPLYRFGTGDATDTLGNRGGQLDVVVEYPIAPSLPLGAPGGARLYLAESVAAVIEVKSDVAGQWPQALQTASRLSSLERSFGAHMIMGGIPPRPRIPLFVAGHTGWKTVESLRTNLGGAGNVAAILVIDSGLFVSSSEYLGMTEVGPSALWGLISVLHLITNSLQAASTNPLQYAG